MSTRFLPEQTEQTLETLKSEYFSIFEKLKIYLAGGTALAFFYRYRISYDLDFFTEIEFVPEDLLKDFQSLQKHSIVTAPGTLKFIFKNTNISFFHYPYKLLKETDHSYGFPFASKLDIALMKITAIADRCEKKDIYDLYYIAQETGLENIFNVFENKYPDANKSHYIKSLNFLADAEKTPEPNFITEVPSWEKIKLFFSKSVSEYIKSQIEIN